MDPNMTPKMDVKTGPKIRPKNVTKTRPEKGSKNGPLFPTCLISEREARQNEKIGSAWWWHVVAYRCLLPLDAALCHLSSLRALSSLRSLHLDGAPGSSDPLRYPKQSSGPPALRVKS